jgi:hypothetical protein
MKTYYVRINRLIPLVGVMLVVAGVVAVVTYVDIEHKIHADEALTEQFYRLYYDHTVSTVLKKMQEGDVLGAKRRLDLMLCGDILEVNANLASASDRQKAYTQHVFANIARTRPSNALIAAGTTDELSNDQVEAQKILMLASAGNAPANSGVAVAH